MRGKLKMLENNSVIKIEGDMHINVSLNLTLLTISLFGRKEPEKKELPNETQTATTQSLPSGNETKTDETKSPEGTTLY